MDAVKRVAKHAAAGAALSGVLLSLGFPPVGFWLSAWVALVPLYVVLVRIGQQGGRRFGLRAFGAGGAFGMALFLVGMVWMVEIGSVPWVILSAIETAPIALQLVLFAAFVPLLPARLRPFAFAALWCVFEWLRSQTVYAFPWFILSSTQVHALPLLQIVSLTGQWGLSFFIALVNGFFAEAWLARQAGEEKRRVLWPVYGASGVLWVLYLHGVFAQARILGSESENPANLTVSIIQGNITKEGVYSEEAKQEAIKVYLTMTGEAVRQNAPAFVLWPETVTPDPILRNPFVFRDVSSLAERLQTPLLVGTPDVESRNVWWNTAVLFTRDGRVGGRYDKQQLVPMGEFFLFRDQLGSIYEQYGVTSTDFSFGTRPGTLSVETAGTPSQSARVGTMICYDDVFSKRGRERVLGGAQILAVLTSDQTFGTTAGPAQHIEQAAVRAAETHRYLVRAAANGKSQFISPTGRVQKELPLFVRGVLTGKVGLRDDITLFVRWGDWWVGVCAGIIAGCAAWPLWARRRKRPAP